MSKQPIININGDDLNTDLENIMWELFKKIQENAKTQTPLGETEEEIPKDQKAVVPKKIPKRKLDL